MPRRLPLRALPRTLESLDTIPVTPDAGGSIVEYEARLNLRGVARVFSPLLGPSFHRIGERARHSLESILSRIDA